MLAISPRGLEVIRKYEGFLPRPYLCPGGYWTIGYGHLIKKGEVFDSITKQQAETLLMQDCAIAEDAVARLITTKLRQGEFDALVSFVFNVGGGVFRASTLRRVINQGEHELAAGQFRRWVYAGGVKLPGLVKRREDEIRLFYNDH